ncbi:Acetyltransferase (isoleucine patch superfamily) [Andreprevotia lacus DSM 23236]|jgi:acetyltransferase-like isoleucine patch superfamily enzyme/dTDP-4-dehydrorhamnose 3,5-epimerase-like enzyme|uniref:Acetyltransferase (Isoleucine patch superfamily) n=1 Tax=Andreprevotia lacus DSM 23236 TaxID=1121001 RepID=A0A1W1XI40_9NEIS|nr:WxcM-like domain-containing protein [Andreprevotia lacus]SMC23444.1 Acetyltransferase (isoleucine patch superfamily) [Andreprevotia lacus DSM 23236]
MSHFVHPAGLCESQTVGEGTRVWAFAHVLPGARIGADCNICDHVFIENDVVLGDRVTVKCGVQLWDGLRVGNDVFIGPNATFTNDRFPRSKQYPEAFAATRIEHHASIGANATILPGLTIGQYAMVGAGAVVTHSVPPYAIVVGNPGRIVGYATNNAAVSPEPHAPHVGSTTDTGVHGVQLREFPIFEDMRGALTVGNFASEVPFIPNRYFMVFAVPSKDVRGEHAHKACEQFLICVRGSVRVVADDGKARQEFVLDGPQRGLYLPAMTWASQYAYSADAVLLVFASHAYDADDYIRDYATFLAQVGEQENA